MLFSSLRVHSERRSVTKHLVWTRTSGWFQCPWPAGVPTDGRDQHWNVIFSLCVFRDFQKQIPRLYPSRDCKKKKSKRMMSNALFLKCFNMMSVEHSTWISVRKVIWHLIYMFIRIFMIFVHRSKKIPGGIHYSALERLPMIQNRTVLYLGFQSRNLFFGNHEKGRGGENLR